MNKLTKKEHKTFAPLNAYEDSERAKWLMIGALIVSIIWLISL